ncbi:MAG TPA: IS21 family transposase [Candidatus Dormibacteraeota bacterium]|nr:IS21 family transposase [Candidatus Dormibacteraeota bacterium]
MSKSDREIMEILEAYDLTRCAWTAARLAGCDPKTVSRYVTARDLGRDPRVRMARPRLAGPYQEKIEEWVERSHGAVRADVVHERLRAMGYDGDERTTRRAVATAKQAWVGGRRRTYRPWIPEPGMWLQFDWGKGPEIRGRGTLLFCAWLAWSRYRVIIPTWDRTLETALTCLDGMLRLVGGVPTYLLTDNERTVTMDRVAGIPVRHPEMVAAGRHYGCAVETCVPYDPESKGGSESTVKVSKADLVPTDANLLDQYPDFPALARACQEVAAMLNGRVHRETQRAPEEALQEERRHLHRLPEEPYTAALGLARRVNTDQTIRFGSVRYSTPPGFVGESVWCRVQGEELVVVARTSTGLREIARHTCSRPGQPQILDAHYPGRPDGSRPTRPSLRPTEQTEIAFCALGPEAELWLRAAAAQGVSRIRSKMADAVVLAAGLGREQVALGLGLAATAGRFGDGDLVAIVDHQRIAGAAAEVVVADELYSAQPGTSSWAGFGK